MAKIIFLQNIEYQLIGTMSLSAVLKKNGHFVDVLVGTNLSDFLTILKYESPQIVAFSTVTGNHRWVIELARELKNIFPSLIIILGGPHPTFHPEIIHNSGINIICRGEGEGAFLDLANALDKHQSVTKIKNLWVKAPDQQITKNPLRPLIENLDSLPFPDRDLYWRYPRIARNQTQIFMAGRGCPYNCNFCFDHQLKALYQGLGSYVRLRSPINLLNEIKNVCQNVFFKNIYFIDDTFILNKKWLSEFCKIYSDEIHLPFNCLVRADLVNETVVQQLFSAKCHTVFFGIETGNEHLRNVLLKKNISNQQIIIAVNLLKKYKIKIKTYNILGLPGETLEDAFETVRFNIKIKCDYPWASIYIPYLGTELASISMNMGLLPDTYSVNNTTTTFHSSSILQTPHAKTIENLHKFFQTAIVLPWTFPLIRQLIKLPPNILFKIWFAVIYGIIFIRSEGRGYLETSIFGIRNLKHLIPLTMKK